MNDPLINIITRTSDRPSCFRRNVNSVRNQTYKNIRHIIIADNKNSMDYVNEHKIPVKNKLLVDRNSIIKEDKSINPNTGKYFPQNLYFNIAHGLVDKGWIIYLDDDDLFKDKSSISNIVKAIKEGNEDTLIYWQIERLNRDIFPTGIPNPPRLGQISSASIAFHSKHKKLATWDGWKCSDFRVIDKLHKVVPKKIYIPEVLVFMPKEGLGNKEDI